MAKDNKDTVCIALVHYVCPICGKPIENDSAIVMNTVLTKKRAEEVNELNGKAVGYSKNACNNCIKHKENVVYVIEVDEEKSTSKQPYRTGRVIGLKKSFQLFVDHPEYILHTDNGVSFCFMSDKVLKMIGFEIQ